jgi:hypothetical protein
MGVLPGPTLLLNLIIGVVSGQLKLRKIAHFILQFGNTSFSELYTL